MSHATESSESPLVSVVTPFFNTADYLAECIESVLKQGYRNLEYILVDNCSTDGSGDIAEAYARRDKRVRAIREKVFLGQIENYNRALTYVSDQSRYCKIVQADDWIFPDCLREMVNAIETSQGRVGLVGSYSLYETEVLHGGLPHHQRVIPGREMLRVYLRDRIRVFGSPTCVLYRTADVRARSPWFEPSSIIDDIGVCFDVLCHHDFAFVHQVLTFNRRQRGSTWVREMAYGVLFLQQVLLTYRYGPSIFSASELRAVTRDVLRDYYWFLGDMALRAPGGRFWQYHAQGLGQVGLRIDKARLARSVLWAFVDTLGNPKRTVLRVARGEWGNPSA